VLLHSNTRLSMLGALQPLVYHLELRLRQYILFQLCVFIFRRTEGVLSFQRCTRAFYFIPASDFPCSVHYSLTPTILVYIYIFIYIYIYIYICVCVHRYECICVCVHSPFDVRCTVVSLLLSPACPPPVIFIVIVCFHIQNGGRAIV